jgi:hypothetical protein
MLILEDKDKEADFEISNKVVFDFLTVEKTEPRRNTWFLLLGLISRLNPPVE